MRVGRLQVLPERRLEGQRDLRVEQRYPVTGGRIGLQQGRNALLVVLLVELAEIVLRVDDRQVALAVCELLQEEAVGGFEFELDRLVVDLGDLDGLAGDREGRVLGRRKRVVHEHVFVPEHDVVDREGLAVAPFQALAQLERVGRRILGGLELLGERRPHLLPLRIPAHKQLVGDRAGEVVLVAIGKNRRAQRAAVLADAIDHGFDIGFFREAGRNGGQLAGLHLLVEHRRLLVVSGPGRTHRPQEHGA